MALSFLKIQNLRNLQEVELEPAPGLNILLGRNGAGKTSILEAIYILSRGRSFRSDRAVPVISREKSSLEVFARFDASSPVKTIGVRKGRGGTEIRMNGESVKQLSQLARVLPQLLITPRSHEILERGPEYRRRFMDWGVFHVEQGFLPAAKSYRRVLRQRNEALKRSPRQLESWNLELVKSGLKVDCCRQEYVKALSERFLRLSRYFLPEIEISLSYAVSAETEQEYLEKLQQHHEEELKRGYTQIGPHRADLKVKFEGRDADKVASRGEQKLILAALFLAQAELVAEKGAVKPILLVDDLPAELDRENRGIFLEELTRLDTQVMITGTEATLFDGLDDSRVFHVEQGVIS